MVTNGGEIATKPKTTEGLARWSPFEELNELRNRMDDVFARAFGYTPLSHMLANVPNVLAEPFTLDPPVDLFETEDRFEAYVAVPGYNPEMITINAAQDCLTIEGQRNALRDDKEKAKGRSGLVTGSSRFNISYTLPAEIVPDKIKATFKDGVLHLEMPKSERAVAKTIKVKVEKG